MEFGLSMVKVEYFDFFSSLNREMKLNDVSTASVSENKIESLKLKKYIPSTCINNCIGISKFIKNCLFECCSNSMQIPLTQLYLAVGCSDYTLLFTLFGKVKDSFLYKSEGVSFRRNNFGLSHA